MEDSGLVVDDGVSMDCLAIKFCNRIPFCDEIIIILPNDEMNIYYSVESSGNNLRLN
jgi:hypothetical protein